jgi:hypothetical protein
MSGCASLSQRSSTGSRPRTPLTLYVAIFIGLAVTLGFPDHRILRGPSSHGPFNEAGRDLHKADAVVVCLIAP